MVQPIPVGYHTATPYLIIKNAAAAIEFYKKAFGAIEQMRLVQPDGKIGHAEIKIGNSVIMLADEFPEMGAKSPEAFGGSPISILLYVENVDEMFQKSINAGAIVKQPLENKFYGDRMGTITDPFGHCWSIGTHIQDVSPEEIKQRMEKMYQQ